MRKTPEMLSLLMGISLLVITGFQVYWLNNNYDREKRSMEIKTNVLFQEAVRDLQTSKLKMSALNKADSAGKKNLQLLINDEAPFNRQVQVKMTRGQEVITMVNSLRKKLSDSVHGKLQVNSNVVITMNKDSLHPAFDSSLAHFEERATPGGNRIFRFLYGVDSLQDTLKVPEITRAYQQALKDEKMSVPFSVLRLKDTILDEGPDMAAVTVGFAKPITYKLQLGNVTPILLKKLTLPILFSIFLIGFTFFSFVFFYRTVLKQERLARIKNEFISNITHELKTPIATVGVAIEALQNFNAIQDAEKTKEYLDISSNELQRLGLLVDKVLKLSMLEKKEIEIRYEPTDLNAVIQEAVNSMKLQFEKSNATVTVSSEGSTMLYADRLHLLSVVYNLLDNAIKYCNANPVITIGTKELDKELLLRVSDNGIGIAPEYKNKVFEKFFRVPAGDTHNAHGYGLGLSYVAHIIAQHNGSIQVISTPGNGTEFIIKLPKSHAG